MTEIIYDESGFTSGLGFAVAITSIAPDQTVHCSKRGQTVENNKWCPTWKPKTHGDMSLAMICAHCGYSREAV